MGNSSSLRSSPIFGHSTIYNEVLRDARTLRTKDKKNDYNQHRREQSIARNLPKPLRGYSRTIHVVNEWWLSHIVPLPITEQQELMMVLYSHLSLNCAPFRRVLLANNALRDMSNALQILNIFGYFIRSLIDPSKHSKLFQQLRALGKFHDAHSEREILDCDVYEAMLCAMNHAFNERFATDYDLSARCCMGHLHRVITSVMTQQDFLSIAMAQRALIRQGILPPNNEPKQGVPRKTSPTQKSSIFNQIDGFLGSMEECLGHKTGAMYFKKFMQEQFCVENFLFHESVVEYQRTKAHQSRRKLGEEIMAKFIVAGSVLEVNLSYGTRFQCTQIVDLVKMMNENREKYRKLISLSPSKLPTTNSAAVPLELAALAMTANENIQDVVHSMGFTESLFNEAYSEVMNLMRINSWQAFRRNILEICGGDDDFIAMQREKMMEKRELQRSDLGMIQLIHSIKKKQSQSCRQSRAQSRALLQTPDRKRKTVTAMTTSKIRDIQYQTPERKWNQITPRFSFVPSLMPSIEKSITSPASWPCCSPGRGLSPAARVWQSPLSRVRKVTPQFSSGKTTTLDLPMNALNIGSDERKEKQRNSKRGTLLVSPHNLKWDFDAEIRRSEMMGN